MSLLRVPPHRPPPCGEVALDLTDAVIQASLEGHAEERLARVRPDTERGFAVEGTAHLDPNGGATACCPRVVAGAGFALSLTRVPVPLAA